jgi:HAD superfamily hydrolase (TIGR01484 family)
VTSNFDNELSHIDATLAHAFNIDIVNLQAAIAAASEGSLIAVGSGGSYTVASLLCSLHEAYTGRVSRAVTPLELICNPTVASNSPIFIISAEGKNPDILEALQRARRHSSRAVHVITNRASSPLMEKVNELHDVTSHVFELKDKDGYLATNSLILDASLLARTYATLNGQIEQAAQSVDELVISGQSLKGWLESAKPFVAEAVSRRGLILVFSPHLRPVAEDLESKLSEAALLFCQLCDFRSFAHGRHLWLTERSKDSALLVLTEPDTMNLWADMQPQLPAEVPKLELQLDGSSPKDLIGALIASMHLISKIADQASRDIAKPSVSSLGRKLYYANLENLIPSSKGEDRRGEDAKYEVLGAFWPNNRNSGKIRRAFKEAEREIGLQNFRAIVFDYDGTLCSSSSLENPPSKEIVAELERLAKHGVVIGIASGRGGSIGENLIKLISPTLQSQFRLGLYNGGWVGRLGDQPEVQPQLSEFLLHVQRTVLNLKSYGVPITEHRSTAPYQLSIRFQKGVNTESMWFVIVDALKQSGLETSTVLRSKHSIDVLAHGVSKSHLIARIVQDEKIDPYEIVTMGDLGAWPGNDSSLLQHRYSLSVDLPSRRLDRGWKLAPKYIRDVDATLWYLSRAKTAEPAKFRFEFEQELL